MHSAIKNKHVSLSDAYIYAYDPSFVECSFSKPEKKNSPIFREIWLPHLESWVVGKHQR